MNIENRLNEIWENEYLNYLPKEIKERKFCYASNNIQKDILITGINPSFRRGDSHGILKYDFSSLMQDTRYDRYWTPIKKILKNEHLDLINKAAYLDIFYFREKEQAFLRNSILKQEHGLRFIVEQLNVTQHIIEQIIKPKLIIVKNRESSFYWGRYAAQKGIIWMGYDFEFVRNEFAGELYKIKGLLDSPYRIAPEIKQTNLTNSYVLFTAHITRYTEKGTTPTPELINEILLESETKL
jgi:hypothetical protein